MVIPKTVVKCLDLSPLFATLTKTAGVYPNSSQNGTPLAPCSVAPPFKCYNARARRTNRDLMSARLFLFLAAAFLFASASSARQAATPNSGTWSGTIVYSSCNADEAFNESPECFRAAPGAKLALYDDTNRVMYSLEPQGSAAGHLGDTVTVSGTLEDDTIRIQSLELMSIGLAVGQKAPAFSARDQFGRAQTLDSLKGPNGAVLLFFRSADW